MTMLKRIAIIPALGLGVAALPAFHTPAAAQNTTCSNRPVGDISNACANTRFVSQNAPALGWIVVGSASYPTIQDAFNAAKALPSSFVWIPCGTYTIGSPGSATLGIDLKNTTNIHVAGPDGPNGGVAQCAMVNYVGTGTAIEYGGSVGFEWEHVYLRTNTGSRLMDGRTGSVTNTTFAYFHDSSFVGLTGTTVLFDVASGVHPKWERNLLAGGTIGIRGITSGAGIPGGQFVVAAEIGPTNSFQPSLTVAAIQGMNHTANVHGNSFQGQLLGYSAGPASTCITLNWEDNWHGDATTPQPLIQSNCQFLNSSGNTYTQAGGTAITQTNSTGKVSSKNDSFGTGTWIDIGTGNLLALESQTTPGFAPVITGTPATIPTVAAYYGQLSVGTTDTAANAPFVVASRGSSTGASGISLVASDYATNTGLFSINKDTGSGGSVHINASDIGGISPIVIDSGLLQLGGTLGSAVAGSLRFVNTTSGSISIQPAAGALGTGIATLPAGTYNLVGDSLSQTLTNKVINCSNNTCSNINATNIAITNDTSTNATVYPVWVTANTGNLPAKVTSTKFSFNPSLGTFGLGTGTAPSISILEVTGAGMTGATQLAMNFTPTFNSSATNGYGIFLAPNTSAASFTLPNLFGLRLSNGTVGAGSAITTQYQLFIDAPSMGGTGYSIFSTGGRNFLTGGLALGTNVDPGTGGLSVSTKIRAGGTAPTISAGCNGAGSSISGSDLAGQVTGQTAAATTCTITFNAAYAAAPYCVATGNTSPLTGAVTASTTTLVVNFASTANYQFSYICMARSGG